MPNDQSLTLMQRIPWFWWSLTLVAFALDQITKWMAQAWLEPGEVHVVTSFFNFQLRFNPGAAFSFLASHDGWQRWFFAVIASVVSLMLAAWIYRSHRIPGKTYEMIGLSLILSGALGNLYDRIAIGEVVDFIVWHYQVHEWPAFNIADAAICAGAGFLVLDMFKGSQNKNA